MLIPLGILAASGAGVPAGDYELIETFALGSNQASVIFNNLNQYASTYKHLQVRAVVRANRDTFQNTYARLRFNNDTGNSYSSHYLMAQNSGVVSFGGGNDSLIGLAWITTQNAATNNFGAIVVDILDPFSTSKNKTVRTLGGSAGTDEPRVSLASGAYFSTNAVSSITLFSETGNLIAGSRFSLYGVK